MATSATGTITAAIDAYIAGEPDDVLKEFHTDARIVGSKKHEKWDKKSAARDQLATDLVQIQFGGAFVNSRVKKGELKRLGDGAMLFHRAGDINVTEKQKTKKLEARWTVVLKSYADGWKVVHSHFSFEE